MKTCKLSLLLGTLIVNIALWLTYILLRVDSGDFGSFPPHLQLYSLVCFGVSYACNLAFLAVMLQKKTIPDQTYYVALSCVLLYYILQLGFIPSVRATTRRRASKWIVRSLLLLCVLPVSILAGIGVESKDWTLSVLGLIVVLHVCLNDAILYGFLF